MELVTGLSNVIGPLVFAVIVPVLFLALAVRAISVVTVRPPST